MKCDWLAAAARWTLLSIEDAPVVVDNHYCVLLGSMGDQCGIVAASSLFDLAAPTLEVMVSKDWVP